MARSKKFSRIPLPAEFAGVPREAIATYTVLASYAENKTGMCWPKMETLAEKLRCSVRTIQRHLHALREAGLVEFVERRRWRGRFSSYCYRLVHYAYMAASSKKPKTTGHGWRVAGRTPNKNRTKPSINQGQKPQNKEEKRAIEAEKRKAGYSWLFE